MGDLWPAWGLFVGGLWVRVVCSSPLVLGFSITSSHLCVICGRRVRVLCFVRGLWVRVVCSARGWAVCARCVLCSFGFRLLYY